VVKELFPAYGNVNANSSNANFPNVGGNAGNNAGNVGIFYCNVNNNSTNSNANNGSRNSGIHYAPTVHQYKRRRNPQSHAPWQNTKAIMIIPYIGTLYHI
jgi:hypothetical protein